MLCFVCVDCTAVGWLSPLFQGHHRLSRYWSCGAFFLLHVAWPKIHTPSVFYLYIGGEVAPRSSVVQMLSNRCTCRRQYTIGTEQLVNHPPAEPGFGMAGSERDVGGAGSDGERCRTMPLAWAFDFDLSPSTTPVPHGPRHRRPLCILMTYMRSFECQVDACSFAHVAVSSRDLLSDAVFLEAVAQLGLDLRDSRSSN